MKDKNGFSIIELITVIGIISILTTIGSKTYYKWKLRAVQTQALTNLSSIYTLQQIYFSQNEVYLNSYSGIIANGFEPNASDKYAYTIQSRDGSTSTFLATSTSKKRLASCSSNPNDIWTLDEVKKFTNTMNGSLGCQ